MYVRIYSAISSIKLLTVVLVKSVWARLFPVIVCEIRLIGLWGNPDHIVFSLEYKFVANFTSAVDNCHETQTNTNKKA